MSFSGKNSRRSFLKLSVLSGLTAGFGRSAVAEPEEREESAPVTAAARDLDIVDFRCRPPIKPMKMLFDMKLGRQKWPSEFANPLAKSVSKSMSHVGDAAGFKLLTAEMDAAGVDHIVMPGRNVGGAGLIKAAANLSDEGGINVSDEMLLDLQKEFAPRATGLHGINVLGRATAADDIERALTVHELPGAVLEIGYFKGEDGERLQFDDPSLFPIYETMVANDAFMMVQSGIYAGPDIGANDWPSLDLVMQQFPTLKVVLAHGGYPRVLDALALAVKHPNMYISPDIYCSFPGGELYVNAISQLPDQFLFASAYPFGALRDSVDYSLSFDLSDTVMEKFMGANARRLLAD